MRSHRTTSGATALCGGISSCKSRNTSGPKPAMQKWFSIRGGPGVQCGHQLLQVTEHERPKACSAHGMQFFTTGMQARMSTHCPHIVHTLSTGTQAKVLGVDEHLHTPHHTHHTHTHTLHTPHPTDASSGLNSSSPCHSGEQMAMLDNTKKTLSRNPKLFQHQDTCTFTYILCTHWLCADNT